MMPVEQNLIGQSPSFVEALEQVSGLAPLNKPVLIIGERGTGKELIASRLHYLSTRWDQALLKTNCAALPESLLESDLFGHEAGAFTGATQRHIGRFERAHEGSLFLDEIANMSMRVQEKLLRTIEYGEFERVGGSKTLQVDVRIIGATNMDLPALAAVDKFRSDLLDRLSFDVITLPPLRHRREDIMLLAHHYARGMVKELKRELFPGFTRQAQETLESYHWPGNLRELKNVVERAVYRCAPERPIGRIELDPFDSPYRPRGNGAPTQRAENPTSPATKEMPTFPLPTDLKQAVREFEIARLNAALEAYRYNQRETARALGLTYHQLRGYLRKYELLSGGSQPHTQTEN
jgi:psp operon transcriptional activator